MKLQGHDGSKNYWEISLIRQGGASSRHYSSSTMVCAEIHREMGEWTNFQNGYAVLGWFRQ